MNNVKETLLKNAREQYGSVSPCSNNKNFEDCYTKTPAGETVLWFNTRDNSTHVVIDRRQKNGSKKIYGS